MGRILASMPLSDPVDLPALAIPERACRFIDRHTHTLLRPTDREHQFRSALLAVRDSGEYPEVGGVRCSSPKVL
jgi:hypothetical protein